jgi:hypothetical protein
MQAEASTSRNQNIAVVERIVSSGKRHRGALRPHRHARSLIVGAEDACEVTAELACNTVMSAPFPSAPLSDLSENMKVIHDLALLAPVPLEHLQSGKDVAADQGFVAFGTRKWELLRKLDEMRQGVPVPTLIYPSHEDDPAKLTFLVCWYGLYVGSTETPSGQHPLGMKHRPPTTSKYPTDNLGHWAAFWHVKCLRELPKRKHIAIGKLATIRGGWRKDAPPRGPELVARPDDLSDEDSW